MASYYKHSNITLANVKRLGFNVSDSVPNFLWTKSDIILGEVIFNTQWRIKQIYVPIPGHWNCTHFKIWITERILKRHRIGASFPVHYTFVLVADIWSRFHINVAAEIETPRYNILYKLKHSDFTVKIRLTRTRTSAMTTILFTLLTAHSQTWRRHHH